MAEDDEHFLVISYPVFIPSVENLLFRSLSHLLITLVSFILGFLSSLYILNINPLSDRDLAKILPYSEFLLHPLDHFLGCSEVFWSYENPIISC